MNSLQQDYNTYAQYAQSLESDLAYAQQNGEDTTDIQSQIDTKQSDVVFFAATNRILSTTDFCFTILKNKTILIE